MLVLYVAVAMMVFAASVGAVVVLAMGGSTRRGRDFMGRDVADSTNPASHWMNDIVHNNAADGDSDVDVDVD